MNKSIPPKEVLLELCSKGYSMDEIAKTLDMSVGKIHKFIVIYEIQPRKHLSDRAKEKISNANMNNAYRKGKKATDATKEKISQAKSQKGVGHKKLRSDGYIAIYFPDHPLSNKDGYIMEHDLVMECFVGRWLKENEVVHHINKIRSDNRIENLKLMTNSEHSRLHMLERIENQTRERFKKEGVENL